MSKQLYLPVLVTGLSTKVDGSIKIALETRELAGETAADVFNLRGQEAWCVLSATEMKEVSIPTEKPDPAIGTKTQSQRIRNVLFKLWDQGGRQGTFEGYYQQRTEVIIEQLKEKLL